MRRERELERRLAELPMPGEAEAEERSWDVVRAAYADRTPVRPTYRARRFALAAAAAALLLAIGLSPAGAQVGDWVRDVVGEDDAKPELRTLPAAGEILVEGGDGVWIVRDDGSKRRLGDYDEATWSPNGLYVAVTDGNRLAAVTPEGDSRWDIEAPAAVHDPRWAGTEFDTRIAYRSGGDLWVVAGDGSSERLIARDVAPVPPAWRPLGDTKLGTAGSHVVLYLDKDGRRRAVDVDMLQNVPTAPGVHGDRHALPGLARGDLDGSSARAFSPTAQRSAVVHQGRNRSRLVLTRDGDDKRRILFSGPGRLTGPTWSPDGRWILVGWVEADQWLFINADRPKDTDPFGNITEQFEGTRPSDFPHVAGWVLPSR
jgi:WD40-like Beta Propeller Repeat